MADSHVFARRVASCILYLRAQFCCQSYDHLSLLVAETFQKQTASASLMVFKGRAGNSATFFRSS
jgi:hypothetical protein